MIGENDSRCPDYPTMYTHGIHMRMQRVASMLEYLLFAVMAPHSGNGGVVAGKNFGFLHCSSDVQLQTPAAGLEPQMFDRQCCPAQNGSKGN